MFCIRFVPCGTCRNVERSQDCLRLPYRGSTDRPEKNKPLQSISERYIQLDACKYVDEIIPYESEEDLLRLMQLIDFDVRIIGEEYEGKDFTGKDYALANFIQVYYNKRHHNLSTSNLRYKMEIENGKD